MTERQDLDERLLEYGARIIKLVESQPKTLVGKRIGDRLPMEREDGLRSTPAGDVQRDRGR